MHLEFQPEKTKGENLLQISKFKCENSIKKTYNKLQEHDIDVTVQGLVRCEKGIGLPGSLKEGVLLYSLTVLICGDELDREGSTFNYFEPCYDDQVHTYRG